LDDTLRIRLEAALGTTCTIEREDPRPGTFVGRDPANDRLVVIRVVPEDRAEGVDFDVFARAIEPLATLDEPNVVPVLGAGQGTDGLLYYVMPFLEGETLRHHLAPGALPVDVVVKILHDVAAALQYVHGHGVDHRELSIDHVWLSPEAALVTDFGIAAALATAKGARPDSMDVSGDLFAWGVLADQLLSGAHAFTEHLTSESPVASQFAVLPTQRTTTEREAPAALSALVLQSLAKDTQSRPQTAADLLRALEAAWWTANLVPAVKPKKSHRRAWQIAGTASVAVLAFGLVVAWLAGAFTPKEAAFDDDSAGIRVGMLPLYNDGAPDDDYLVDGVSEGIRGRIATLPSVMMVGRASSLPYKGSTKALDVIGAELNVRYMIIGSVRVERDGAMLQLRVQTALMEVRTGRPLWKEANTIQLGDLFNLQAGLAQHLAPILKIRLTQAQQAALLVRPTQNLAALEAFLHGETDGRGLTATDLPTIRKAIADYSKAVSLDDRFALAWARLARAHMLALPFGSPADAESARHAVDRAMELAPQRWESQWVRGMYSDEVSREHRKALAAQLEAVRLGPGTAETWDGLALAQSHAGTWDDALASAEHALLLDTRSVGSLQRAADVLMVLGRNDEASAKLELANSIDPLDPHVVFRLMLVRLAQVNREGAREEMRESPALKEDVNLFVGGRVVPWMLDPALQDRLMALRADVDVEGRGSWALSVAQIYSLRGNFVRARAYADSARASLEGARRDAMNDYRIDRGLAQAYSILNRHDATLAVGARSLSELPMSSDRIEGGWNQYLVARTYVAIGEKEESLKLLDQVLAPGGYVQPGWVRLDPAFASLSGNAHFERLTSRLP
jgi:serine/threonine-protein kinase